MNGITIEKARYIIIYYSGLLTPNERLALRHARSTFKLDGVESSSLTNSYYRVGWPSTNPEVLGYLSQGEDQFLSNCATRILNECADQVFLNLCPACGKLARTPDARQCRFCGNNWH